MKMENLELCEAIKEVVNNVLDAGGYQRVRKFDENNKCYLWLEAEWDVYDDTRDIIMVYVCYTDTGRVIAHIPIMETITNR